jgi:hypothetical protein
VEWPVRCNTRYELLRTPKWCVSSCRIGYANHSQAPDAYGFQDVGYPTPGAARGGVSRVESGILGKWSVKHVHFVSQHDHASPPKAK